MTRRKIKRCADFELVFSAIGAVHLFDTVAQRTVWSSDDDEEFAEEFDGDFFDGNDEDEILEYLAEKEFVDDDTEIDIIEEDADGDDDETGDVDDDDNIIDADFTPAARRTSTVRGTRKKS